MSDNYLGSGNLIRCAKKKYGKQNFKREILECFDTKEKAYEAQEKYINQFNTLVPNGYNISSKGGYTANRGTIPSEDTKQKQSNALKGIPKTKEHKQHIIESKMGEKNPMFGKTISEKTRQQIIESNMGRIGEKNPMFGKHHKKDSIQKMRERKIDKKLSIEHIQHISESYKGKFYITNGIVTKQLKKGNPIPENWKLGRKQN